MFHLTITRAQRWQQRAARNGINNAGIAYTAAEAARIPYSVACALLQKESGGRNIFGHDAGGALSGYPGLVTPDTWSVFRWLVITQKHPSNGVGPCQLTYPGFFTDMEKKGLKPYSVHDNMLYGFQLLAHLRAQHGSWEAAGTAYNGSPAYGKDLAARISNWVKILGS